MLSAAPRNQTSQVTARLAHVTGNHGDWIPESRAGARTQITQIWRLVYSWRRTARARLTSGSAGWAGIAAAGAPGALDPRPGPVGDRPGLGRRPPRQDR